MTDALDFIQKRTILVVDDTPDNLVLMSEVLEGSYNVKLANNGDKKHSRHTPYGHEWRRG